MKTPQKKNERKKETRLLWEIGLCFRRRGGGLGRFPLWSAWLNNRRMAFMQPSQKLNNEQEQIKPVACCRHTFIKPYRIEIWSSVPPSYSTIQTLFLLHRLAFRHPHMRTYTHKHAQTKITYSNCAKKSLVIKAIQDRERKT